MQGEEIGKNIYLLTIKVVGSKLVGSNMAEEYNSAPLPCLKPQSPVVGVASSYLSLQSPIMSLFVAPPPMPRSIGLSSKMTNFFI